MSGTGKLSEFYGKRICKQVIVCLFVLFLIVFPISQTFAACDLGQGNGTRPHGTVIYNTNFDVLRVCRTDNLWYALGPFDPGDFPTGCPTIGEVCSDGSIFAGDSLYVTDANQSTGAQWKTSAGANDIDPDSLTYGKDNHSNRSGNLSEATLIWPGS